jgi:hypothetical protein
MYPTYDENTTSSTAASSWKSEKTGFFIDKKGYITTNYHVIKNAKELEINNNNKSYNAKVIISDEQNDSNEKIIYYLCRMKKVKINKDKVLKSVSKMLSDKEVVRSYMKGKTSINTLSKKGIKLANPL